MVTFPPLDIPTERRSRDRIWATWAACCAAASAFSLEESAEETAWSDAITRR